MVQIVPQLLIRGLSKDLQEIDDLLFSLLRESGVTILTDALNRVIALLYKDQPTGHATSLKDYEKLFPVIALPTIANTFQDDEVFAYMRVAGYNPVMIERVTSLSDRFPVKDEAVTLKVWLSRPCQISLASICSRSKQHRTFDIESV
jgi:arachidonate 15-lipoxygenase